MLPANWKEILTPTDAIFFGAVGWPATVPDHVSLWGSLLQFRREFDQYVNLPRPADAGVPCRSPAASPRHRLLRRAREHRGRVFSVGGTMYPGTEREIVIQETVMSRHGVDRILKFAFRPPQSREKKHLTSATKSNGIAITMPYWDQRVEAMASATPRCAATSTTSTS